MSEKKRKTSSDWSGTITVRVSHDLTSEDLWRLAFARWESEERVFDVLHEIYDDDMTPWEQFYEGALSAFEEPRQFARLRRAFEAENAEAA